MPNCAQCGADLPEETSCIDCFNLSQIAELEKPGYYAVHHLSVPCYMLQHNIYTREGWLQVYRLLHRFVYEGFTPKEALKENKRSADSGNRNFSFTRGPKLPGVEIIQWKFTIADVRLDTVENYCADVLTWAKHILKDAQDLVESSL
ncbi:MAG: hypothetical protein CVU39_27215 [Chloroflexi bacterium HGW-Chloroflexi-10]|nr:MAG: hypothetical protein CVU39_27215 [Chloroflexi bacterium HGW-Chloroflexi-10]